MSRHPHGYIVVERGTTSILGGFWTENYEFAVQQSAALGGIVTNLGWIIRKTGQNPVATLQKLGPEPAKMGAPRRGRNAEKGAVAA